MVCFDTHPLVRNVCWWGLNSQQPLQGHHVLQSIFRSQRVCQPRTFRSAHRRLLYSWLSVPLAIQHPVTGWLMNSKGCGRKQHLPEGTACVGDFNANQRTILIRCMSIHLRKISNICQGKVLCCMKRRHEGHKYARVYLAFGLMLIHIETLERDMWNLVFRELINAFTNSVWNSVLQVNNYKHGDDAKLYG